VLGGGTMWSILYGDAASVPERRIRRAVRRLRRR
jgi:hypothetical protein